MIEIKMAFGVPLKCKECNHKTREYMESFESKVRADEREKVLDEILKSVNLEEKWLHDAIREDNGNYAYNIDIAFSVIKNNLKQLKEKEQ